LLARRLLVLFFGVAAQAVALGLQPRCSRFCALLSSGQCSAARPDVPSVFAGEGWERWLRQFDAPPLAAFPGGGGADLLAQQAQQLAAAAAGAVQPALTAGGEGIGGDTLVLVTAPNGATYGVPASHFTFEAGFDPGSSDGGAWTAGPAGQCAMPGAEGQLAPAGGLPDGGGAPTGAVQLFRPPAPAAAGGEAAGRCERGAGEASCEALPEVRLHPVHRHSPGGPLFLPAAASEPSAVAVPGSNQPQRQAGAAASWLLLLAGVALGGGASAGLVALLWRQRLAAALRERRAEAAAQRKPGQAVASAAAATATPGSKGRRRGGGGRLSNRVLGSIQQAALEGAEAAAPAPRHAGSPGSAANGSAAAAALPPPPQQQPAAGGHDDDAPRGPPIAQGSPAVRQRTVTEDGAVVVGHMKVRRCSRRRRRAAPCACPPARRCSFPKRGCLGTFTPTAALCMGACASLLPRERHPASASCQPGSSEVCSRSHTPAGRTRTLVCQHQCRTERASPPPLLVCV
jgi:hypothetical protein